jgi:hypothetical protein
MFYYNAFCGGTIKMTKVMIGEIRVPEEKLKDFCECMDRMKIGYCFKGEFRITNLLNWLNGKQKLFD